MVPELEVDSVILEKTRESFATKDAGDLLEASLIQSKRRPPYKRIKLVDIGFELIIDFIPNQLLVHRFNVLESVIGFRLPA